MPMLKKRTSVKSTPHQVFLHFMMMAMLYVSVISLITLVLQYIDLLFPDELIWYGGVFETIRYSSSSLIVAFPIFLLSSWLIGKEFEKSLNLRQMAVRKWLIYLTLFVAGITMIVDMIQLVDRFYSGELTVPFLLKVVTILVVTGCTFGYLVWELKEKKSLQFRTDILAGVVSIVLLIILGGGFLLAGTPGYQRDVRLDEKRVQDLQSIQYEIIEYWRSKEKLPEKLTDLERDVHYFEIPVDPETEEGYEYSVANTLTFEVCATFATESKQDVGYPYAIDWGDRYVQWGHTAGRVCFERTIDPDFYREKSPQRYR